VYWLIDASGENDILITPLATADLDVETVEESIRATRDKAGVLLLQLEIRTEITCHAAREGAAAGLTVVLDPAPAQPLPLPLPLPENVWQYVDVVTPNKSEAGALSGVEVDDLHSAGRAAAWFLDRSVKHALTLGSAGALSVTEDRTRHFPAVTPVDTTAAGNAGFFGAALAAGLDVDLAIRRGAAAGALATTRPGASPSLPDREAVDGLINTHPLMEGAAQ
jgi:ribokinase